VYNDKLFGGHVLTNSQPIAIDLFAGAGGLSYGLSEAGFDVRVGVEIDREAALTLGKNHQGLNVIETDMRMLKASTIFEHANLNGEQIALVAGGPPCRGFSVSNRKSRHLENPLNSLYHEFFRIVKELSPKMFLFENVEGVCTLAKGSVLKDILDISQKLGYFTNYYFVNSEKFGVPQKRKRVLFIGSQKKPFSLISIQMPPVSVREAIDDLPVIENGNTIDNMPYSKNSQLSNYQKIMRCKSKKEVANNKVSRNGELALTRYKLIPQGGNWKNLPPDLMSNYKNLENCHRWIYYRLKWNEPSIVISNFRKNMLIHPQQDRGLSVREAARLQSFPDHYVFHGQLGSQQQQIANAVPPILAKWVGSELVKGLEELD
jgi:DNA (cytosine-5)-methyltransferase 1